MLVVGLVWLLVPQGVSAYVVGWDKVMRKGGGLDLVFGKGTVRVEEFRGQAADLIFWQAWPVTEQGTIA